MKSPAISQMGIEERFYIKRRQDMAFFELDDILSYQAMNRIKTLWASITAPSDPGIGEIWLDTSVTPNELKQYSGSSWMGITPVTETTGIISRISAKRTDGAETIISSSGTTGFIGTLSNHELRLTTNNAWKMVLTTSGNVGIGTLTPSQKLEVAGNVEVSGGGKITVGGSEVHHAGNTLYDMTVTNYGKMLIFRGDLQVPTGSGTVDVSYPYSYDYKPSMGISTDNPTAARWSTISTTGFSFIKHGTIAYNISWITAGIRS